MGQTTRLSTGSGIPVRIFKPPLSARTPPSTGKGLQVRQFGSAAGVTPSPVKRNRIINTPPAVKLSTSARGSARGSASGGYYKTRDNHWCSVDSAPVSAKKVSFKQGATGLPQGSAERVLHRPDEPVVFHPHGAPSTPCHTDNDDCSAMFRDVPTPMRNSPYAPAAFSNNSASADAKKKLLLEILSPRTKTIPADPPAAPSSPATNTNPISLPLEELSPMVPINGSWKTVDSVVKPPLEPAPEKVETQLPVEPESVANPANPAVERDDKGLMWSPPNNKGLYMSKQAMYKLMCGSTPTDQKQELNFQAHEEELEQDLSLGMAFNTAGMCLRYDDDEGSSTSTITKTSNHVTNVDVLGGGSNKVLAGSLPFALGMVAICLAYAISTTISGHVPVKQTELSTNAVWQLDVSSSDYWAYLSPAGGVVDGAYIGAIAKDQSQMEFHAISCEAIDAVIIENISELKQDNLPVLAMDLGETNTVAPVPRRYISKQEAKRLYEQKILAIQEAEDQDQAEKENGEAAEPVPMTVQSAQIASTSDSESMDLTVGQVDAVSVYGGERELLWQQAPEVELGSDSKGSEQLLLAVESVAPVTVFGSAEHFICQEDAGTVAVTISGDDVVGLDMAQVSLAPVVAVSVFGGSDAFIVQDEAPIIELAEAVADQLAVSSIDPVTVFGGSSATELVVQEDVNSLAVEELAVEESEIGSVHLSVEEVLSVESFGGNAGDLVFHHDVPALSLGEVGGLALTVDSLSRVDIFGGLDDHTLVFQESTNVPTLSLVEDDVSAVELEVAPIEAISIFDWSNSFIVQDAPEISVSPSIVDRLVALMAVLLESEFAAVCVYYYTCLLSDILRTRYVATTTAAHSITAISSRIHETASEYPEATAMAMFLGSVLAICGCALQLKVLLGRVSDQRSRRSPPRSRSRSPESSSLAPSDDVTVTGAAVSTHTHHLTVDTSSPDDNCTYSPSTAPTSIPNEMGSPIPFSAAQKPHRMSYHLHQIDVNFPDSMVNSPENAGGIEDRDYIDTDGAIPQASVAPTPVAAPLTPLQKIVAAADNILEYYSPIVTAVITQSSLYSLHPHSSLRTASKFPKDIRHMATVVDMDDTEDPTAEEPAPAPAVSNHIRNNTSDASVLFQSSKKVKNTTILSPLPAKMRLPGTAARSAANTSVLFVDEDEPASEAEVSMSLTNTLSSRILQNKKKATKSKEEKGRKKQEAAASATVPVRRSARNVKSKK